MLQDPAVLPMITPACQSLGFRIKQLTSLCTVTKKKQYDSTRLVVSYCFFFVTGTTHIWCSSDLLPKPANKTSGSAENTLRLASLSWRDWSLTHPKLLQLHKRRFVFFSTSSNDLKMFLNLYYRKLNPSFLCLMLNSMLILNTGFHLFQRSFIALTSNFKSSTSIMCLGHMTSAKHRMKSMFWY